MEILNKLIEAGIISENDSTELQEGFTQKLDEARNQIRIELEEQIRTEFATRYEHDKSGVIEAIDKLVTDNLTEIEATQIGQITKLREAQDKYDAETKNVRKKYSAKLKESMNSLSQFTLSKLEENFISLEEAKKEVKKHKEKLDKDHADKVKKMEEHYAAKLKKIDEFVIRNVTRELEDFQKDQKALVETRVKLIKENKEELARTQKDLIRTASKRFDEFATKKLANEMKALHEDVERSRNNAFGARIFEAIVSEFMTSHYADHTGTKQLSVIVESQKAEIAKLKEVTSTATKLVEAANRKAIIAEGTVKRTKIMNELLSNLNSEKKQIMEDLLANSKTENLRESFKKYLPTVINDGSGKTGQTMTTKRPLVEAQNRTVTVTGDKVQTRSSNPEEEISPEMATILRLAGQN